MQLMSGLNNFRWDQAIIIAKKYGWKIDEGPTPLKGQKKSKGKQYKFSIPEEGKSIVVMKTSLPCNVKNIIGKAAKRFEDGFPVVDFESIRIVSIDDGNGPEYHNIKGEQPMINFVVDKLIKMGHTN